MDLADMLVVKFFCFVYLINYTQGYHYGNPLNKYVRHYEGLSYNTYELQDKHLRAKRALLHQDTFLHLDFHAHGRHFNLRMKRDTSLFAEDLKVDMGGQEVNYDTSHIYTGEIYGEKGTLSHGSVVDGKFEGFIQTYQGTFYVEPAERYLKDRDVPFHSVIYHEDDINYPHKYGPEGGCADHSVFERMKKYQATAMEEPNTLHAEEASSDPVLLRKRRTAQIEKNTCQLFIQTDHLFFKYYKTREAVIAQISSHIKAIDAIYQGTDFMGIRNISFMVKRIRINTTTDERDRSNPFRFANIGVEKFLELNSEQNHDDYCLAYVFTDRDFDDGVLGLAWVGAPAGSSGGICEKSKLYSDGKKKSLNTGIITVQNYASHVPPKVSHITFAHEVGHNFGSPHDSGSECTPGESKTQDKKEKGNYIMYARATSGDKLNNNKFSVCSVRNISQVLEKKRGSCFVESGQPICGNGLVEPGEECDCGYSDQCRDQCCYDADQPDNRKCKLKPNKVCSPSQGPCCTPECYYKGRNEKCREESECAHQGMCNGGTAQCPTSEPKANFTACHGETQVCLNGGCSGSICEKYGLEVCTCASVEGKDETDELCHVCCSEKMNPNTCSSTGSEKLAGFFNKKVTTLPAGSPCNDFKGYCDVFMRCRLVDADGPLARLKKAIFNPELYENIAEWIVAHWWAVLLMGIALIMLMAGFIKICSVHTPSSNPKLPPPKPLPGECLSSHPALPPKPLPGECLSSHPALPPKPLPGECLSSHPALPPKPLPGECLSSHPALPPKPLPGECLSSHPALPPKPLPGECLSSHPALPPKPLPGECLSSHPALPPKPLPGECLSSHPALPPKPLPGECLSSHPALPPKPLPGECLSSHPALPPKPLPGECLSSHPALPPKPLPGECLSSHPALPPKPLEIRAGLLNGLTLLYLVLFSSLWSFCWGALQTFRRFGKWSRRAVDRL
ncbi:disintegrin and metalloproteinase domain-containing protein 10-like isoform X2 [Oncorhynchus nerka]|uniref:disintegrin and metalloproteinase domain-containing protein 10-like isoform X2 n=1 Tax=Oncorhynchus nerka TaxID=8023 RepID=UPI0031B87BE1